MLQAHMATYTTYRINLPEELRIIDFDLKKHRMSMSVNIVIDDPEELERVRQKEMDITRDKIKKIIDAGTNVIFTTKGIDDMAMKYLTEAGVLGISIPPN